MSFHGIILSKKISSNIISLGYYFDNKNKSISNINVLSNTIMKSHTSVKILLTMKYISILMVPCLKEMKPKFQFSIVDFFLETEYGKESGFIIQNCYLLMLI